MFTHEIDVILTDTMACRVVVFECEDNAKQVRDIFERTVEDAQSAQSFAKWVDSCIGDEITDVKFTTINDFGRLRSFKSKLGVAIKHATGVV